MPAKLKAVLSLAGFDPCGGAGILADIKTFESCGVYGCGVLTALTYQNDLRFSGLEWIPFNKIQEQLQVLSERFDFAVAKIGLIENLKVLSALVTFLLTLSPNIRIVWDPILKASAGYVFHSDVNATELMAVLDKLYLVTPNFEEVSVLAPNAATPLQSAQILATHCAVFLKGGHSNQNTSNDLLFANGESLCLPAARLSGSGKHGSGCVLSACIAAELSKGSSLLEACQKAKLYTLQFLKSSDHRLGQHRVAISQESTKEELQGDRL